MNLPKLVVSNMARRRGRFIFTLLGITIGIGAFVTFLALGGSLKKEVMREANALGANLIVTPKGSCAYEQVSILTGEVLPSNISMEEYAKVSMLEGMTVVPILVGAPTQASIGQQSTGLGQRHPSRQDAKLQGLAVDCRRLPVQ